MKGGIRVWTGEEREDRRKSKEDRVKEMRFEEERESKRKRFDKRRGKRMKENNV